MSEDGAFIGVSDHAGWAVLVTADRGGTVLDRRRVVLLDAQLPVLPHHHEAQALPLEQALDLIGRVRASAEQHAVETLDALAAALPSRIRGVALRECPPLPPTTAEQLRDYRAQNVADTVMYRQALAGAAGARRWRVHWYKAKTVFDVARDALRIDDLDAHFMEIRRRLGPPWSQDHRLATAAAIVAAASEQLER